LCRFGATIVLSAHAARLCLLLVFEQQNFVNNRDLLSDLNFHERAADCFADVGGVHSFAPEYNAEAYNGSERELMIAAGGETRGDDWNFIRTWDAENLNFAGAGASQFGVGGAEHGINVFGVVLGSDDGKAETRCARVSTLNWGQHGP
jgi:hypothetical protein